MALDRLKISSNSHYFVIDDGQDTPFFWLGDDAWALFTRLTVAEARTYLQNRADYGFTVIHTWFIQQWDTNTKDGDSPFTNPVDSPDNITLSNGFWSHVEAILDEADTRGLRVIIELGKLFTSGVPSNLSLDTWGTQAQRRTKAYNVGYRIANRLRTRDNAYFGCGGDFAPDGSKTSDSGANVQEKIAWMAAGIADGWANATYNPAATSSHFATCPISMHPGTPQSNPSGSGGNTADYFGGAGDTWLAYHQLQSGRASRFFDYHYQENASNYTNSPIKPTLDTESGYEDTIPIDEASFRRRGWHVRAQAYLGLFAGGAGFNYGHLSIWQMRQGGYSDRGTSPRYNWNDNSVLNSEGAQSMRHLRNLMESRPLFTWAPDQTVFTDNAQNDYQRLQAILDASSRYAMVYTTNGRSITFDLSKISGATARAYWFDPRNGTSQQIGEFATSGTQSFDPPGAASSRNDATGNDYVLVVDDTAQNYPPPGNPVDPPTARPSFVMAHRGGGNGSNGERPENTLQSFRWAWQNGCNPERDLDDTQDGRYIFMHDATVDRTTNGSGTTASKTYNQIRQLDAGSWFHPDYTGTRVPELNEVLQAFAAEAPAGVIFSIDPDSTIENQAGYNALAAAIAANDLWERVFIECSNTGVADALRATDSRFRLAVWCSNQSALTTALAYAHYERIHMASSLASQVGSVHAKGKTAVIGMGGADTLSGLCAIINSWDEPADGVNTNRPKFMKTLTDAMGYSS